MSRFTVMVLPSITCDGLCKRLVAAGTFRVWARLMHRKPETLYEDAMNAATVKVHGLTVLVNAEVIAVH